MKKKYNAPQTKAVEITTAPLLESSFIQVGGDGKPKGVLGDWDDVEEY